MRLLVAEDERDLNEIILQKLKSEGYSVDACYDGAEAMDILSYTEYDAVLLDIMMPKADGYQVLEALRASGKETPVLFLTARDAIEDRVRGLDSGACDYLVKPFGMMEMVSRVKAVLRRCAPVKQSRQLSSGGVTLDLDGHTVTAAGQRVTLTFKEFALLQLFLAHPGMAFTRDQLFNDVWGADYVGETRTVDMHIRTLRQKLGECGDRIETVRGVGYRWEARP